ncbi:MAG: hypothetical protein JXA04_02115 [Gammaproteobacteria bacterium]|nr:hypothetical protein [Gammaproteobacteria bacterium]
MLDRKTMRVSLLQVALVVLSIMPLHTFSNDGSGVVVKGAKRQAVTYLSSPVEVEIPLSFDDSGIFESEQLANYNIDTIRIFLIKFEVDVKEDVDVIEIEFEMNAELGCDKLLNFTYKFGSNEDFVPLKEIISKRDKKRTKRIPTYRIDNEFTINADEGESLSVKKTYIADRKEFDKFMRAEGSTMFLKLNIKPNC